MKTTTPYVPERMDDLVAKLLNRRKKAGNLKKLEIDLHALEGAIKKLPKNHRRSLEVFFGLVPGSKSNYRVYVRKTLKELQSDVALADLESRADDALGELCDFTYVKEFDKNLPHIIEGILSKIDRTGTSISDDEVIKYLLAYIILIEGGPLFSIYENDAAYAESERLMYFDHLSLLDLTWSASMIHFDDHSFRIAPIIEYVHLSPLKRRVKILQMFNLKIPNELKDYVEGEPLSTLADIRKFKEELFPYGEWSIFSNLLLIKNDIDLSPLGEKVESGKWLKIANYEKNKKVDIALPSGKVRHTWEYKIGELTFTDLDEIIFLYLARRLY